MTRRLFLATPMTALAQKGARGPVLSGVWPPAKLGSALLPAARWRPFPPAADRAGWEALPPEVRNALVEAGARHLGAAWPSLPATLFLEYARNGNRSNYERARNARRERLRELVVAECAEGKGRFLDEILNGIWLTAEETFWGVPAHMGLQKAGTGLADAAEPVVDLFAAETASLLAWTDYLLGPQLEKLSPLLGRRIRLEEQRRILTPNLERDDFWWMGLNRQRDVNNWNPWINSNWLTTALLIESDEKRRLEAVNKILRSLDRFLDAYHDDGGCDEGPGYWFRAGASLFDCLELLHSASNGAIDFYSMPLVREIGRYIYRAHIFEDWFVNFADASAKVGIAGDLVYRYGRRIGDEDMQALGAWAAQRQGTRAARSDSIGRQLAALFNLGAVMQAQGRQPLVRDVWMPGIQVMAARLKGGSAQGLYLAAQGGHNAESHNHNDVGNFIVYADGQPAIIDVGVETYSAKTFSSRRYDIWTMQSGYHNAPTINGVMQSPGRQFAASEVAYKADDGAAEFSLNIERAYPAEAGVRSWRRTLRLDRRAKELSVREQYALSKPARRITLTLMTPRKPVPGGAGELRLEGVRVAYDARVFEPVLEEIKIEDARLRGVWGERLYRILLGAANPPAGGDWTVRITQA